MTCLDEPTLPPVVDSAPIVGSDQAEISRAWAKKFSAAILVVYLMAFVLPVFDDTGVLANHLGVRPKGAVYGWQAFLVGWFAQRWGGWFANVAIWVGTTLLAGRKPLAAAIAGLIALALGSTYLAVLSDHSLISPQAYSAGFFCWLASAMLLAASGLSLKWLGPDRRSIIFAAATVAAGVIALVMTERHIVATTAPPSDAALTDQLISGDVAARRAAARKLGLHHQPELIPTFIAAIKDSDDKVRQYAISALGDIGPPAAIAVPRLIEVLRAPAAVAQMGKVDLKRTSNSRSAAAAALGSIGPAAKEAVPALADVLKDENVPVRRWAATSLGQMGTASRAVIPALIQALGDADVQVRRYAIQSLQQIGPRPDAIPKLSKSLQDQDATVREIAATLLDRLRKSP
jgi:HEAT repeat protein